MSAYNLEHASLNHIKKHFDLFEAEARSLLDLGLAIPAYVLSFFCIFHFCFYDIPIFFFSILINIFFCTTC